MTMSKQDFEVIAERIHTFVYSGDDTEDAQVRGLLAVHFADALRATNGAFNRDKFIRACETGAHIRRSILPRA